MTFLKRSNSLPQLVKNTALVTSSGLAIAATVGVVSIWQNSTKLVGNVVNFFHHQITAPNVDTSHLLVKQIQGVSELTTTVFVMDAIVPTSSRRKLGDFVVGETKLLYLARGEVTAGLDLSQITEADVTVKNNQLEIQLPAPQILDSKIDVNQSEVYDYDRGFLNLGPDNAPELQTQAQRQTLAKIKANACNQGILSQANERATLTLTQLFSASGYEEVNIKTTEPTTCI